jgi:hypothetical protein
MNRIAIALTFCLAAPMIGGCDDDTTPADMGGSPDLSVNNKDMTSGFPAAPTLGMQIDRMGRPAVNTALTDPFDIAGVGGIPAGKTEDQVKDAYNSEGDQTKWAASFAPEIATNLAILDGADNVCGNGIAASSDQDAGNAYATPAALLADDELYVNTTKTTCNLYLGVEAAVLGVGAAAGDCGGRTPLENVIDESYTLIISGVNAYLGGSIITNGITAQAETAPSLTAFPFLSAPN